jgi:hypothetical protein
MYSIWLLVQENFHKSKVDSVEINIIEEKVGQLNQYNGFGRLQNT